MNPYNPMVTPMLTDLYQITMAYGYWKNGIQDLEVVFDVFFRKNPFGGEFTVFAGLEDILRFISEFRFTNEDIAYLRTGALHNAEPEFFEWLKNLDCSCLRITSLAEGTLTFPKMPLVRIEGPLALSQLLETTILNLVNYASLVATNAARYRLAVGSNKILMEFGLRRAQGPDGAFSAS
ncbi:MAG TPA: nicotinate phosphoribosyltransferase, partial [Planctomycetota bacterium]|nr:nicotinate phosphoribosyltransferase [Planctomycetota bacterium]